VLRGLAIIAALLALIAGVWTIADARSFQLFGSLVHRIETEDSLVALTFDDGPTPEVTDTVLSMLAAAGVRGTFFFMGSELERNPDLGRRYIEAGHELGNHSYSHRRMVLKSPGFIASEIERTDSLIRVAGHVGPIHFRPPYGKKLLLLPWYLWRRNRVTVMWDVEPDSYADVASDRALIVEHVRDRVQPGSIIILHVMYKGREESLAAVPGIISALREDGYEFVTVSELLER
jgi:chitin deacetylase